jgi:DNA-binding beta-propeller fold protein YncE
MKSLRDHWQFVQVFIFFAVSWTTITGTAQQANLSQSGLIRGIQDSPTLPFVESHFSLRASLPGWELASVSGVAVGTNGDLYVVQRGAKADPILVFNKRGDLLRSWGRGDFTLPHSLRLDPLGNVWAVDAGASKLIKYTPAGNKLLTITIAPIPNTGSPFRGATDIAFAPNGHLFITDGYGNARILEYTAKGEKLREWGHFGTGPMEFRLPHAIQISQKGTVFVADRENGRIEKFDLGGSFQGEFDHLGRCYAITLRDGVLWASTSAMSEDPGSPGWLIALDPESGRVLGHLNLPEQRVGHAFAVSELGELIVTAGDGLLYFQKR